LEKNVCFGPCVIREKAKGEEVRTHQACFLAVVVGNGRLEEATLGCLAIEGKVFYGTNKHDVSKRFTFFEASGM
jgi:hypothetical protein